MEQTNCTRCGKSMPLLRLTKCGYSYCLECSNTPKVGCAPITNHKTGNTIQILPMELANRITRLAQRQGYGVCKGMKASF
jgi:hypothetical protein